MNKLSYIIGGALIAAVSFAHAQTPNQSVSQGEASVDKNLSKNPDNKGLTTADQKLEANEAKIAKKRAAARKREEQRESKTAEKHEHEKMEHQDMMERPERPERPAR